MWTNLLKGSDAYHQEATMPNELNLAVFLELLERAANSEYHSDAWFDCAEIALHNGFEDAGDGFAVADAPEESNPPSDNWGGYL